MVNLALAQRDLSKFGLRNQNSNPGQIKRKSNRLPHGTTATMSSKQYAPVEPKTTASVSE